MTSFVFSAEIALIGVQLRGAPRSPAASNRFAESGPAPGATFRDRRARHAFRPGERRQLRSSTSSCASAANPACSDDVDNDGNGLVDSADAGCRGPLGDDEVDSIPENPDSNPPPTKPPPTMSPTKPLHL
jgi:hypothetical protein